MGEGGERERKAARPRPSESVLALIADAGRGWAPALTVPASHWLKPRVARRLSRLATISLIVLVCAALPLLAYASPPDPIWVQGLYDDADGDDVIALVLAVSWHPSTVTPPDLSHSLPLIGNAPQHRSAIVLVLDTTAASPRAPPPS